MTIRLRAVALTVACLVATALVAADQPPRNLKFVDGHWTAWDPPANLPEGARVHVVERGDTFWALAAQNLGNPYLWPQLWEKNQYVLDAHWIYPGDPLVIDVAVAPASPLESAGAMAAGGTGAGGEGTGAGETQEVGAGPGGAGAAGGGIGGAGGPGAGGVGAGGSGAGGIGAGGIGAGGAGAGGALNTAPSGGARSVPVPLGSEDDIYCAGFVGGEDETFAYTLVGSEYEVLSPAMAGASGKIEGIFGTVDTVKVQLTAGDIVYLDGGSGAGLSPGMVLTAVEPSRRIVHPVTRQTFGRQYNYMGRVRVLSVNDGGAIGEVVQSCTGLRVGSLLKPFVPEPVPLARRTPLRPVNDPTSAEALEGAPVILSSPLFAVSLGQDHVVFIDRGEDEDVLPGDLFTIYRANKEARPPVVLGELAVLSVQRHSALARILESRYPIYIGDRLERK